MEDRATGLRIGVRVADRYEIRSCLGTGGMGVVYEAIDRHSDEAVALKTLHPGAGDPQLIKREFRVLADVMHPNVVRLYDLFDDAGLWCLTMELVPGVDLMTDLRGAELATATVTITALPDLDAAAHPPELGSFWPPPDLGQVRDRFAQLARGVGMLHRRGLVHRDLKPHNVRVTPEGRTVLLDFGLAAVAGAAGQAAGTVVYMPPEQAEGVPVAPSADWYSFGVLLHEALTGKVPWTGSAAAIVAAKRVASPVRLRDHPALPRDLAMLADDLLEREPGARPTGAEVLDRLGQRRRRRGARVAEQERTLIGRTGELAQLEQSWQAVVDGGTAWIAVEGKSGVGKSTLVAALARATEGAVLHGRCYERESVAYKGIDQIVDALVERLHDVTCPEARELVPAFPAIRALVSASFEGPPLQVGHERHGAALRSLIGRLAEDQPVLIVLDDIQWADRDCLALVSHALAPPGIPRVMVVVVARPDRDARWNELPMPFVRLRLGALAAADALELAQSLLGRAALSIDGGALARESAGDPLELVELVRAALSDDGVAHTGAARLLIRRVANAPAEVRLVAELAVVAGAPIPAAAIGRASGLVDEPLRAALDRAQLAGLIRNRRAGARMIVEPAHDRVREVLFEAMSPIARAQRAGVLATVLEGLGHEAAHVAELYVLAGQPAAARRCAEIAAHRMTALGGHDAAAALWRVIAELSEEPARHEAMRRSADSLAVAGRGSEAADLYHALADTATALPQRMHDLRRAAEELLRAGKSAEGLAIIASNLPGFGDPASPVIAMARGLALHAATRVGMLPRSTRRATAAQLEQVDLRWAAIAGYTLGSPGHFTLAVEQHLRQALVSGDPERIALGWTAEATLAIFMGSPRFADLCLERASSVLAGLDAPRARAVAIATAALVRLDGGAWARAEALVEAGLELVDRRAPNLVWERNTAVISISITRLHRGELAALARGVWRERERTAARGDLWANELVHSGFTLVADLLADEPARASSELSALGGRPTGVMTAWLRAIGHALVGAYGDRTHWHRARCDDLLAGPLALPLLRSRIVLGTVLWTRIALELSAIASGGRGDRAKLRRWIDRLRRIDARGMRGLAELFAGHAALLAGNRAEAKARGAAAELPLLADDMATFAASARWLVDPTTWPAWRESLAKAGAVDPEAIARLFAPALRR